MMILFLFFFRTGQKANWILPEDATSNDLVAPSVDFAGNTVFNARSREKNIYSSNWFSCKFTFRPSGSKNFKITLYTSLDFITVAPTQATLEIMNNRQGTSFERIDTTNLYETPVSYTWCGEFAQLVPHIIQMFLKLCTLFRSQLYYVYLQVSRSLLQSLDFCYSLFLVEPIAQEKLNYLLNTSSYKIYEKGAIHKRWTLHRDGNVHNEMIVYAIVLKVQSYDRI